MAGYSERIKRIDSARVSVREFFVYGFRTRQDVQGRSGRSYDNDRRRLESWLGDAVRWRYGPGGKRVFVSMDAGRPARNPLHQAWKAKSFTDNDITLHFHLLDLLQDGTPRDAAWLTDAVYARTQRLMDMQTVRQKLKEYTDMGMLTADRQGRKVLYRLNHARAEQLFSTSSNLRDAVAFFSETAPLGTIGSFILDRAPPEEPPVLLKHHFIGSALDDGILLQTLRAIANGQWLGIVNISPRRGQRRNLRLRPLAVMVSVMNGRRHLIAVDQGRRHLTSLRLDYMQSAKPVKDEEFLGDEPELPASWGVSVSGGQAEEYFEMVLAIDAQREAHVLQRLQRELGLSYVLITHDMDVIRAMAHEVLVMQNGEVVEQGAVDAVLNQPQHPYTQQLVHATL